MLVTNTVNGPLLGGEFVMKKMFKLLKVDNVQPKVEEEMTRKLLMIILILDFRMPILKNQNGQSQGGRGCGEKACSLQAGSSCETSPSCENTVSII